MPLHPLSMAVDGDPVTYPGLELLATAVLLLTDTLDVSYANPAAENLFELSRRQLVGNSARTLFGDAPGLFQAIDKALANGASYTEQEIELGVNGKPRLHLSCTVSMIESPDATLLGWMRQYSAATVRGSASPEGETQNQRDENASHTVRMN